MRSSVNIALRSFIADKLAYSDDLAWLADRASLREAGLIDSTGVIELVTFLEEEFGVPVEDEEMLPQNLDSIAALEAFVARKRAEQFAAEARLKVG